MPGPYPLASLAPVIDENGISAPPFEDILKSLQASYRSIYGQDIDLDADTQDGQWIAVQAEGFHEVNQAIIAAYLAYSPTWAQGVGLSADVKINGIARNAASYSSADLLLTGQPGTLIRNGIVADNFGFQWALPAEVTIGADASVTKTAVCTTLGAIAALPDTITQIQSGVPNWHTATNPVSASPGGPIETDAQLRQRQSASTSLPAITPRESIQAAIGDLDYVRRVEVYQNDTDDPDMHGIPPHCIAAVVEGGFNDQIAQTIAYKKNTGCGTLGSIHQVVLDSEGVPNTINFYPLNEVPIWVRVEIEPLLGYLGSTGAMIKDAIAAYITGLGIGSTIYAARLMAPADLAGDAALAASAPLNQQQLDDLSATYVVRALYLGYDNTPSAADDLDIDFTAAASCPASHVAIVIVAA